MRGTTSTMLLMGLVLGTAACSDGGQATRNADDVLELRSEVGRLERRLGQFETELASLERRSAGRARDLARVAAEPPPATAPMATPGRNEGPGDEASPTVTAGQFTEFLSTDSGQQVFAAAMREYQQEQSNARRSRVVSALVEPFAKKAYLSPEQAERLSNVLETASKRMRDTWASMREVEPEQRGAQVAANIQRSREIRAQADEEVAEFLSATQYELFEEEAGSLFGMPGPRRRDGGAPTR